MRAFWLHVEEAPELQVMQYKLTLYALRHPESACLAKQQDDSYSALVETLLEQNFAAAGKPCAIPFAELARFIIAGLDGLILQFISGGRDTFTGRFLGKVSSPLAAGGGLSHEL